MGCLTNGRFESGDLVSYIQAVPGGSQPASGMPVGSEAPGDVPTGPARKTPIWIWIVVLLVFLFAKNPPKL